jgi:hypothetical protein
VQNCLFDECLEVLLLWEFESFSLGSSHSDRRSSFILGQSHVVNGELLEKRAFFRKGFQLRLSLSKLFETEALFFQLDIDFDLVLHIIKGILVDGFKVLVDKLYCIEVCDFPATVALLVQVFVCGQKVDKMGAQCFHVVEFVLFRQQSKSHGHRLVNLPHCARIVWQFLVCSCNFL